MAHINTRFAAIYFAVAINPRPFAGSISAQSAANLAGMFEDDLVTAAGPFGTGHTPANTDEFVVVPHLRPEPPEIGNTSNLATVPEYFQQQATQVEAQGEPNQMVLSLNYVPAHWTNSQMGQLVGDGEDHVMAAILCASMPRGLSMKLTPAANDYVLSHWEGSADAGPRNSISFFVGSLATVTYRPTLSEAATGSLTVAIKSDFREIMTYTRTSATAATLS